MAEPSGAKEVPAPEGPGALFEEFPHRDVFIADKEGPDRE
jgi:hypothetical protein